MQAGRMRLQAGCMRLQAGRRWSHAGCRPVAGWLQAYLVGLEHVALVAQLDRLVVEPALEVVRARVDRHVGGAAAGLRLLLCHLVLRSLQRDEARRDPGRARGKHRVSPSDDQWLPGSIGCQSPLQVEVRVRVRVRVGVGVRVRVMAVSHHCSTRSCRLSGGAALSPSRCAAEITLRSWLGFGVWGWG